MPALPVVGPTGGRVGPDHGGPWGGAGCAVDMPFHFCSDSVLISGHSHVKNHFLQVL